MRLRRIAVFAALVALLCPAEILASEGWIEDLEVARAKAKRDGKDLFIDFTGSDWCGWCKKLKAEVFDTEAFKAEAPKSFVLVELDFPRHKPKPARHEENKKLMERWAIRGYPTIVLADADLLPYAKLGYEKGGPEPYLEELARLRAHKAKRNELREAFEKASKQEKPERIAALVKFLEESQVLDAYPDLVEKAVDLDGENKLGLRQKYVVALFRKAISDGDQEREKKYRAIVEKLDPENEKGLYDEIAIAQAESLLNAKDFVGARELLKKHVATRKPGAKDNVVYFLLGRGADLAGDKAEAAQWYKKSLDTKKDAPFNRFIEKRLKEL